MIDASDRKALQIAVLGHIILFALLSIGLMFRTTPKRLPQEVMDVQLVGPVGLKPAAPTPSMEAPAESQAPEIAPEKEAPAKAEPVPEPLPAARPEPKPKPADKPSPTKPEPKPKPVEKPTPAKPQPQKREKLNDDILKGLKDTASKENKASGSRLGADFLKGITSSKAGGKSQTPRAALSGIQMRGLASAIAAQVKPCYVIPTGGADAATIVSVLRLRFNPDGSVSGTPNVTAHEGVTDTNRSYVRQMDDAAVRAVLRCSPLRLPPELYEGGWEDIEFGFYPQAMR